MTIDTTGDVFVNAVRGLSGNAPVTAGAIGARSRCKLVARSVAPFTAEIRMDALGEFGIELVTLPTNLFAGQFVEVGLAVRHTSNVAVAVGAALSAMQRRFKSNIVVTVDAYDVLRRHAAGSKHE